MKKRVLSAFLAAVMACTLLCIPAGAEGKTETVYTETSEVIITNVIRKEVNKYKITGEWNESKGDYDFEVKELAIYVVEPDATITISAKLGYSYDSENTKETDKIAESCTNEYWWNPDEQAFDLSSCSTGWLSEPEVLDYRRVYAPWAGVPGYASEKDKDYRGIRSYGGGFGKTTISKSDTPKDGVFITSEEEMKSFIPYQSSAGQEPSDWAKGIIENAKAESLLYFDPSGIYQERITRLQFAQLAVNMLEKYIGEMLVYDSDERFTDTDDLMVRKAHGYNIVSGKGDGKFAPNDPVTRQELCVMLRNVLDEISIVEDISAAEPSSFELDASRFHDTDKVASWARNAVATFTNNGIMSGSDGGIAPEDNTTVEQAIALILALHNKLK